MKTSIKTYSKIAGILYLLIAIIGGLSIGYVPGQIMVEGDSLATFNKLSTHQSLFRWGMIGDMVVIAFEIVLTVMLFQLFKTFSQTAIRIATFSRLAMVIIMGMNLIFYIIPLVLLKQPDHLASFDPAQLRSFVFLSLKIHGYGIYAWQIFFAFHLLAMGIVICRAKITSKTLAGLMTLGSFGYAGDALIHILNLDINILTIISNVLLVFAVISEFWLAFWLIFKGVKKQPTVN